MESKFFNLKITHVLVWEDSALAQALGSLPALHIRAHWWVLQSSIQE